MSDTKSEAREFWINTELHEWEVDTEPVKPRYSDNMDLIVHVIEMSAYQDLKAKHDRVLQMLEATRRELLSLTFRGNCPRCDQAEISIQHVLAQTAGLK